MLARAIPGYRIERPYSFRIDLRASLFGAVVILGLLFLPFLQASARQSNEPSQQDQFQGAAETNLQVGTDLTRQGKFSEAIPHLLAARGHVADEYAASFNLALCYVASGEPKLALAILEPLQRKDASKAAVWNLSAQAYVADGQGDKAITALQRAAQITPNDARLYSYVADACRAARDNLLGLKVVDLGLRNVPQSPRLHYERAVFLIALDRMKEAKQDFEMASELGKDTDIGYLAAVHESLIEGNLEESIQKGREAISKGKADYILLSLYADALFRSGVYPGSPGLAEAERAAEESIAERADYAPPRITLGKLYRIDHRLDDSIRQLEAARKLDPQNPAVYSNLATVYRLKGDREQTRDALAVLERLNKQQVIAIRDSGTKTGERRGNVSAVQNH